MVKKLLKRNRAEKLVDENLGDLIYRKMLKLTQN